MKNTLLGLGYLLIAAGAQAQPDTTYIRVPVQLSERKLAPIRKFHWGNALDGMIFSAAHIDPKKANQSQALRLSLWLNLGFTYNYNFCNTFGMYTGLDMKNIGYISKSTVLGTGEITNKRRVYALGMPLGFRLGNMKKRDYFFAGGGMDLAFHYKEKQWIGSRSNKIKFSEWFGSRSETFLPYVFAGFAYRGTTIRVQYYPGSFMNQDYTLDMGGIPVKPYSGEKVHLMLLSIGRDLRYSRK